MCARACFATMQRQRPDFFIHSGDTIYADHPLQAEVRVADGTVWKNVVTEARSKPAETLDEYRGNYKYNLTDKNVLAFNAEVPMPMPATCARRSQFEFYLFRQPYLA